MSGAAPVRPGWYPNMGGLRYWDGSSWTEQFQPPPDTSRHLWWALSPLYTCGTVSFIPALHAAIKLRRRDLWTWAVGLFAGEVLAWVLVGSGPSDANADSTPLESAGTLLVIVLAAAGIFHAFRTREAVFAPSRPSQVQASTGGAVTDQAVATSLAARRRREESAALSQRDPSLARDLRIGRPDLHRQYDDGGLVDVNHVPESVLVAELGLTQEQARAVVETRAQIDGFVNADDLGNLANLPPRVLDAVRDRIVAL